MIIDKIKVINYVLVSESKSDNYFFDNVRLDDYINDNNIKYKRLIIDN
jgi:hypothetical protein